MTNLDIKDRNLGIGLVLLRILVGASAIYHGSQKLFGAFGGPGYTDFGKFMGSSWRVHDLMTFMLVFGEFFGGVAILAGLFTELAAGGFLAIMIGAWLTKLGMAASYNFGDMETEWLLVLGAAALVFTGPGAFSVDAFLPWKNKLRRFAPYIAIGSVILIVLIWLIFNKTNPLDAPKMG
jgi:putative oxidoreductase